MKRTFGLSGDLPPSLIVAASILVVAGVLLLAFELTRHRTGRAWLIGLSGVLALTLAWVALLRPVVIRSQGSSVGPKVIVLLDRSRSMLLPAENETRDQAAQRALTLLRTAASSTRLSVLGFGEGPATPVERLADSPPQALRSDFMGALRYLLRSADEMPRSIVVVSDGRLEGMTAETSRAMLSDVFEGRFVPVHTVSVARREPRDASIRKVHISGAAVAHQPLQLNIELGCGGNMACEAIPVSVRELLDGAPPHQLASGLAKFDGLTASLSLTITLDRAGARLVDVAIEAPAGDEIPDNNRRIFAVEVARERVRVLHVAGRPTYDVRALRTWLKANASVDVVAFFILRSNQDDVMASESELALIKFPVDELFTEHLPSFDAVILQDFNAIPYGLSQYLGNLATYVQFGGGLVMVGGPDAFLGGGYDGTPLERVLPVDLESVPGQAAFDLADVVPRLTEAGRAAPMLAPLRALFGDELPPMPGANVVGAAKPGTLVLWEHPTRNLTGSRPMPLLTLGEMGDGRSIAIAVDGVHRLGFSEAAARVAGRGHGALWDGLLGWLMRDPRFEPAHVDITRPCLAGEPITLRVTPLPGTSGPIVVDVLSTDPGHAPNHQEVAFDAATVHADIALGTLTAGGYLAKVRVGSGSATRLAFACEMGGEEWADSRPDEATLRAIAEATGGTFQRVAEAGALPLPPPTFVNVERNVAPLLPPWLWTLAAACALGVHWVARRRGGLALEHLRVVSPDNLSWQRTP